MKLNFCIYLNPDSHPTHPNRIDAYISHMLSESRSVIKQHLQQKTVIVKSVHLKNERLLKPSEKPLHQSEIIFQNYILKSERKLQPNPQLFIPILYEDEHLLVVNKPRGLVVNALKYTETQSVANFFVAQTPSLSTWSEHPLDPGVVHRLDQWTSGCLIGVKTDQALKILQAQFKNRSVKKIYLAVVEGQISTSDEWTDELIHHPKNIKKMMVVTPKTLERLKAKARKAVLSFRPITHQNQCTLVEVRLKTGRMHQIRVQFSHRGYPLLGDKLYNAKQTVPFDGYWLHAQHIEFTHPITGERIFCSAPLPEELKAWGEDSARGR